MLAESEILDELKVFKAFTKALKDRKDDSEPPTLPENKDTQKSNLRLLIGLFLIPTIWVFLIFTKICRFHSFAAGLAKLRIKADKFSSEPVCCGLNAAYTELGLALLAKNDLKGAINCLDASWRVHPCPHSVSYGLKRRLVSRLKVYKEASESVEQYIKMGKHFNAWPESWAKRI